MSMTKVQMQLYNIFETQKYGRGIYARRPIQKDTILFNAELLVLSENDTKVLNNQTDLKYYTFTYNETQDCLVLGDGEIFNHDDNSNVSYTIVEHNSRKVMQFKTKRDIEPGEQMFINYNDDVQINVSNEYVDKNLIG